MKTRSLIHSMVLIIILCFFGGSVTLATGIVADRNDPRHIYWKKDGEKWNKIYKKNAELEILEENVDTPPIETQNASATSWESQSLFNPYFTISVNSWAKVVAIGDINSDGKKDVVLATGFYNNPTNDNKVFVFLQNSNGSLNPPVQYTPSTFFTSDIESIDVADVNEDGKDDVVIGRRYNGIEVLLQNDSGTLDPSVLYDSPNSYKIKVGDFDSDGLNDVAGISWGSCRADIFLQDLFGELNFENAYDVYYAGYNDLDTGDVNGDGLTDLIVMSGQSYAYDNFGILIQNQSGTFNSAAYFDLGFDVNTSGVAVGDINNDFLDDVVVTYGGNSPNSSIGCFYQNGEPSLLSPPISIASYDIPESVVIGDMNLDGLSDVVVVHGGWNRVGVYLQNQSGLLETEVLYPISYASHYNPHGLAVGDINGDGSNDIVIADYNFGLVLLYNTLSIPQNPVPEILANGVSGELQVGKKENMTVSISLDPGLYQGQQKDLWIQRSVRNQNYWYDLSQALWIPSKTPIAATINTLEPLNDHIIFSEQLPKGTYQFLIAVDDNNDGVFDGNHLDQVTVIVVN